MGRRRSSIKTSKTVSSSTALVAVPVEISSEAVVVSQHGGGPSLEQLVSALKLEVPDAVMDVVESTEAPKTGRERLRQKWCRRKVVDYAHAVQDLRQCSKKIQVARDEIMRCEATLVLLNLQRLAMNQAEEQQQREKMEQEEKEVNELELCRDGNEDVDDKAVNGYFASCIRLEGETGNTAKMEEKNKGLKPGALENKEESTVTPTTSLLESKTSLSESLRQFSTKVFTGVGIVDLSNIRIASKKLATIPEGRECDIPELETLSDDSLTLNSSPSQDEEDSTNGTIGGQGEVDKTDKEDGSTQGKNEDKKESENNDVSMDGQFSSVYAHVSPFFQPDTGNPTICVANGKAAKKIKKTMIKALLNQPELQRAMHVSPLLREMKDLYMEKAANDKEDGSKPSLCTKTEGCRCEIHKNAHEAMVGTFVNTFVNQFVGIQTAGGRASLRHNINTKNASKTGN